VSGIASATISREAGVREATVTESQQPPYASLLRRHIPTL